MIAEPPPALRKKTRENTTATGSRSQHKLQHLPTCIMRSNWALLSTRPPPLLKEARAAAAAAPEEAGLQLALLRPVEARALPGACDWAGFGELQPNSVSST